MKEKLNITNNGAVGIEKDWYCPVCGWESTNYGNGSGFTSSIEGAEGDWCLRCYVKKVTEGLPQMKKKKYHTCPHCKKKIRHYKDGCNYSVCLRSCLTCLSRK